MAGWHREALPCVFNQIEKNICALKQVLSYSEDTLLFFENT